MQLTHNYYYFKSAISAESCQKIINLGLDKLATDKARGKNTEAYTLGNQEKSSKPNSAPQGKLSRQELKKIGVNDTYIRDSNVTWLNDQWLYDLFHPYVEEANTKAGWNWQWDTSESFQFTVYNPDGFYSWHRDGMSDHFGKYKRYLYGITEKCPSKSDQIPNGYAVEDKFVGKVRKISMTVNLNLPGEYDGGNLLFDFGPHTDGEQFYECEEIRPQGSIIIFPSFLPHCVSPITRGTRYSLVLWTLGAPWK
jgi:PKHD-type hydroxylase